MLTLKPSVSLDTLLMFIKFSQNSAETDFLKLQAQFLTAVQQNPVDAVKFQLEDLARAQFRMGKWNFISYNFTLENLTKVVQNLQLDLVNRSRNSISTSVFQNECARLEIQVFGEILEQLYQFLVQE